MGCMESAADVKSQSSMVTAAVSWIRICSSAIKLKFNRLSVTDYFVSGISDIEHTSRPDKVKFWVPNSQERCILGSSLDIDKDLTEVGRVVAMSVVAGIES